MIQNPETLAGLQAHEQLALDMANMRDLGMFASVQFAAGAEQSPASSLSFAVEPASFQGSQSSEHVQRSVADSVRALHQDHYLEHDGVTLIASKQYSGKDTAGGWRTLFGLTAPDGTGMYVTAQIPADGTPASGQFVRELTPDWTAFLDQQKAAEKGRPEPTRAELYAKLSPELQAIFADQVKVDSAH